MTEVMDAPTDAAPAVAAETETTNAASPPDGDSAVDAATAPDVAPAAEAPDAAPVEEKVGSRKIPYDQLLKHGQRVRDAERRVAECKREWEGLKEETADAKKEYDRAVERMCEIVRSNDPEAAPLFNQPTAEAPQDDTATAATSEPRPVLNWQNVNGALTATSFFSSDDEPSAYLLVNDGHKWWFGDCAFDLFDEGTPEPVDTEEEARSICEANEDRLWSETASERAADAALDAAHRADDESWRSVPLDSLTPKIPAKKLELLANHTPPITTMGELADWQEKKGQWWARDIKGLGEPNENGTSGADKIINAQATFFEARRKEQEAARPAREGEPLTPAGEAETAPTGDSDSETACAAEGSPPPAEDPSFTEDAIDSTTMQTHALIEGHLRIETARRTSGPYQSTYRVSLGKLDKSRPLGVSPQFPTREEATPPPSDAPRPAPAAPADSVAEKAARVATEVMGWKVHPRNTAHWMKATDDNIDYRVMASTCGVERFNPWRNVADDYAVLLAVRQRFGHTWSCGFQRALAKIWTTREGGGLEHHWHLSDNGPGWQYEAGDYAEAALAAKATASPLPSEAPAAGEAALKCHCGLPLVGTGADPWCSGCNMSATVCDCCPTPLTEAAAPAAGEGTAPPFKLGDTVWVYLDEDDMYGAENNTDPVVKGVVSLLDPLNDLIGVVESETNEAHVFAACRVYKTELDARAAAGFNVSDFDDTDVELPEGFPTAEDVLKRLDPPTEKDRTPTVEVAPCPPFDWWTVTVSIPQAEPFRPTEGVSIGMRSVAKLYWHGENAESNARDAASQLEGVLHHWPTPEPPRPNDRSGEFSASPCEE